MYPSWIDSFAKSIHQGWVNMAPTSWGPIDGHKLVSKLDGTFINKLSHAVKIVKKENYSLEKVASCFSSPSTVREIIYWLSFEYQHVYQKDKDQFREIIEYFVKILEFMAKDDLFAYDSNIAHTQDEVEEILENIPWTEADASLTREVAKLYTSAASLVFALYRDFFPVDSHEVYGPYQAVSKFGEGTILVIKDFSRLRPVQLWSEIESSTYETLRIYQVIKDVQFRCETMGMHSIYDGDVINNTKAIAVNINGNFVDINKVKNATEDIGLRSVEHSKLYDAFSVEDTKQKFLEWLCYLNIDFFMLAGMDWRPTEEMWDAVKDKEIPKRSHCAVEDVPSLRLYLRSKDFEIYWLKDLYRNHPPFIVAMRSLLGKFKRTLISSVR